MQSFCKSYDNITPFQWVQEGSPSKNTVIKVENPNQFAPQGENPKEFKQKQKQVMKNWHR